MSRYILLLAGFLILLVATGVTVDLLKGPGPNVLDFGYLPIVWLSGLYTFAQGAWQTLPDPLKRLSASALRKLPTLPNTWKRRAVKNELEGELNAALKEFNREGAGFIDREVKIEWLTPDSDVKESFFRSGKVFLKFGVFRE